MAFQKGGGVVAAKGGRKERPDLEDAFEDSDEGEGVEDAVVVDEDEEEGLSKDKMIKEKKPKGKAATGATAKKAAPKKAKK
jgi:replication factor C subunit 1